MAQQNKAVPKGYGAVTPYLRVKGAAEALQFYRKAFGAKERMKLTMPDGRIGHAEIEIGGGLVMLSEEFPEAGAVGPATLKGTTVTLSIYVADADRVFQKAVASGAKVRRPLTDEFYGDRTGQIVDPFGHVWSIQTRIEDVSHREMQKRLDAMMAPAAAKPSRKPAQRPAKRR